MFADANCPSKRNADIYVYEYTECYTNGYGHAYSDDYAYGYCNGNSHCNSHSYRYGHCHGAANSYRKAQPNSETTSYSAGAPESIAIRREATIHS